MEFAVEQSWRQKDLRLGVAVVRFLLEKPFAGFSVAICLLFASNAETEPVTRYRCSVLSVVYHAPSRLA